MRGSILAWYVAIWTQRVAPRRNRASAVVFHSAASRNTGTQKDRKPRVCGPDSSAERCSIGFHRSRAGCRRYHGIILVCRVIAEINYVRDEILGRLSIANARLTRKKEEEEEKTENSRSAAVSRVHKNGTYGVTGSTVDPWLTARDKSEEK
ncbi:unnamed protein product [Heterotrigona itama]|uniref:Uncharacterized protein n=1 Tax=Heterotrigona itama TaxID=395501 RepID=A0A6V7HHZ6_9HYME|nr:unnamed protein product [Heterotrigona itama]